MSDEEKKEKTEDEIFDEAVEKVAEDINLDGNNTTRKIDEEETVATGSDDSEEELEKKEEEPAKEENKEPDEVQKLKETIMRQAGHMSKLQRQLNEIGNKATVVKPKVDDEPKSLFDDSWKEVKDEFPDINFNKADEVLAAQNAKINNLTKDLERANVLMEQTSRQTYLDRQAMEVETVHPDFKEAVTSKEFVQWQSSLPRDVQQNILSATDAQEINRIVEVFKGATGYKSKATVEAESMLLAQETAAKRKKREAASLGVSTRQPSTPVSGEGVSAFNEDALMADVFKRLGVS